MWPWEHAAVGYLLISVVSRVFWARPPTDIVAVLAMVGTQLPDLVDKPLGWVLEVLPSGVSLAHSVFVLGGVTVCLLAGGMILDRRQEALAFCLAYSSHLVGDVLYPLVNGRSLNWGVALWPFVVNDVQGETPVLEFVRALFGNYLALAGFRSGPTWYVVFELLLLSSAFFLWLWDGRPGIPPYWRTEPSPL